MEEKYEVEEPYSMRTKVITKAQVEQDNFPPC